MSTTIFKRMSCALPPELEKEFRLAHESELDRILPLAGPALGLFVMAFAVWNVVAYGADWQPVLLLVAVSTGLAAIAFRRTTLRWAPTQRAAFLYWVYGGAAMLLAFSSDKGVQDGMPMIAALAFLPALVAVDARFFLWMTSGPLLLVTALAASNAAGGAHGGKLVAYVVAIGIALLLMAMLRSLRQNAFLFQFQLARATPRDGATGLFNRNAIIELAAREFMRARRHERPFAVAMMDIDRFKQISDTFGEQAAEGVVKALADACRAHLREIDLLGRVGGDEFACVLPETGEADALACAERLRQRIEGIVVDTPKGPARLTVSIGIAVLTAEHISWESMLRAADAALYQAKCEGRNRVVAAWLSKGGAAAGKGGAAA